MEQLRFDFESAERAATDAAWRAREQSERPDPVAVVQGLGGRVLRAPRRFLPFTRADFGFRDGKPIVRVRDDLSPAETEFCVAHECGHFVVRLFAVKTTDEERFANLFAGALLVPRPALLEAWRAHGEIRPIIRQWSHVPQTCVALRVGETSCASVFVTQSRSIRYTRARTSQREDEILAIGAHAARRGSVRRSGLRAVRLRDGVERAAVVAAA
jgi:hypothetical protein